MVGYACFGSLSLPSFLGRFPRNSLPLIRAKFLAARFPAHRSAIRGGIIGYLLHALSIVLKRFPSKQKMLACFLYACL
jgi:hypothetical protein